MGQIYCGPEFENPARKVGSRLVGLHQKVTPFSVGRNKSQNAKPTDAGAPQSPEEGPPTRCVLAGCEDTEFRKLKAWHGVD